jgi:uncharacterized protein YlxP (DUF503 family)
VNVALLRISFYLGGCRSLKEKRQRLKGVRDRFGRLTNVAVSESGQQDSLQRAEWSFVATSSSRDVVERTLADIENSLKLSVDAVLVDVHREWLV